MGSLSQSYTKHRQEPELPVDECTNALTEIYRQRMAQAAESAIRPFIDRCETLEAKQVELIALVENLTEQLKGER